MEIILMDKVVNLGNLGDVVKVKDGYARNFLIPQGMAKRANKANIAAFAERKAELEKQSAEKLAAAQARAEKLAGIAITIAQKAGVDGRLFGSINNADIAGALAAQGFNILELESDVAGHAERPVYIMSIQGYCDATLETLQGALADLAREGIEVDVSPVETLFG